MKFLKGANEYGFTLVELLIVIALIAILSVAVLATINPIEQSNKAKDSTVQNDAAEVLNAYERKYANSNSYPWMEHADQLSVDTLVLARSDSVGFGICGLAVGATSAHYYDAGANSCTTASTTTTGSLVTSDELKAAFGGKDEFKTPGNNNENSLWTFKAAGSGGSIYVCYIPKAKSNRTQTTKLYCLYDKGDHATFDKCAVGSNCGGLMAKCAVKPVTDLDWNVPNLNGLSAMFACVP